MPTLPFPPNFLSVTAASPSAYTGADGALYYSAFGRYGSDMSTQGVHVFRLPPSGTAVDLPLPEARPLARGILCKDLDGIYLVAWTKDAGAMVRMKIADVEDFAAAVRTEVIRALGEESKVTAAVRDAVGRVLVGEGRPRSPSDRGLRIEHQF